MARMRKNGPELSRPVEIRDLLRVKRSDPNSRKVVGFAEVQDYNVLYFEFHGGYTLPNWDSQEDILIIDFGDNKNYVYTVESKVPCAESVEVGKIWCAVDQSAYRKGNHYGRTRIILYGADQFPHWLDPEKHNVLCEYTDKGILLSPVDAKRYPTGDKNGVVSIESRNNLLRITVPNTGRSMEARPIMRYCEKPVECVDGKWKLFIEHENLCFNNFCKGTSILVKELAVVDE